ncbi:MAG TPA: hypothetical protein PLN02_06130, partial [Azonexus sp.]|nr:hypothetical protein [Azonexus sp.]
MTRHFIPTLLSVTLAAACIASASANPAPPAPTTASVTDAWCDDLGARLHSVDADHCRKQSFVTGSERTAGGRALVWRDIKAVSKHPDKAPRVLVVGGIHGD